MNALTPGAERPLREVQHILLRVRRIGATLTFARKGKRSIVIAEVD